MRLINYACAHQTAGKGTTFLRDEQEKRQENWLFLFVQVILLHFSHKFLAYMTKKQYLCSRFRVSPTRPAPSELPQVLIEARVRGCSGAM